MKKAMSICLSSCLLVGGLGAATAQAGQTAANPVHTAGSSMNKTNYTLVINGQTLQDRSAYMSQQHLMIPLRSL
ncbi:hypothetical protein, partial [Acinetobacter baumannii]|uniref:hypothetical protein n=1 Tax=Acinetobacter baumannii TaxID=470 RepID=UPI000B2D7216